MSAGVTLFLRRSAAASLLALAALAAPTAGNADERALFISLGDTASPRSAGSNSATNTQPNARPGRRSRATWCSAGQAWKDLERVNLWVNATSSR